MGARIVKNNQEFKQTAGEFELYSDFDHTFLPHPFTGQISRVVDVDSVKQALRNLILTSKYERLRNPDFGGNIRRYLFEPFMPTTAIEMKQRIEDMIDRFEKRVRVIEVNVEDDVERNAILITILFGIRQSVENQKLDLTLYRVR
jgi:phage baseplate assembly protein W